MKYMGMSLSPVILGIVLSVSSLDIVFVISGIFGVGIAALTYRMRNRLDAPGSSHKPDPAG